MFRSLITFIFVCNGSLLAMNPKATHDDPCRSFKEFTFLATGNKKFSKKQLDEAVQKAKENGCDTVNGLVRTSAAYQYAQAGAEVDCRPKLKSTLYLPGFGVMPQFEEITRCKYSFDLQKEKR